MSDARQTGFNFAPQPRNEPWMGPSAKKDPAWLLKPPIASGGHPGVNSTTTKSRREALLAQTPSRTEKMWERIIAYVREHGDATADEITAAWNASPNSIAPRCCELLKLGRLVKTGEYRRTRYGCMAAVLKERP